jgi:hypothetical protein
VFDDGTVIMPFRVAVVRPTNEALVVAVVAVDGVVVIKAKTPPLSVSPVVESVKIISK